MGCLSSFGTKVEKLVSEKDEADRFRVVCLVAGPGVNTSELSAAIKEEYIYQEFSVSNLLKNYTSNRAAVECNEIANDMNSGVLVSSATLLRVLKAQLLLAKEKKILLTGFPKSQNNLDEWNKTISKMCTLRAVIYVELPDDTVKERLRNKGYSDETAENKLKSFNDDMKPMIEELKAAGSLITVDGTKSKEEQFTDVKNAFNERKLYQ